MYIDKFEDAINACRFCFMCRHLDPVGNVTFRESDIPRGRALIADRIRMDPANLKNRDFIDTFYRSALSGANRTHCVSHYDEIGLTLAARRDIVEAGFAPQKVKSLADELVSVSFSISGKGELLYLGKNPALYPGCITITGGDPGKALEVLGFFNESQKVLEQFKQKVAESGCKTLVVAEPSSYHFLKENLDGINVVHCAEYLLEKSAGSAEQRKAFYLESDFLKNYCDSPEIARELLEKSGWKLLPFGTNTEESTAVGEGAVVFDKLNPELCRKLCRHVVELAGNDAKMPFITASLYVKQVFSKYEPGIKIMTIEDTLV